MAKAMTKRQLQAQNSRERLMEEAARLFHEEGYDGVSVDQICQAAGLTKGSFYYHFQSKEDMYSQQYTPRLDAYLDEHYALEDGASASERFEQLAMNTFAFSRLAGKDMVRQSLVVMLNRSTSQLYREERTHTRLLEEAIDAAERAGTLRAGVTRREAILLYACLMNGFLVKWVSADAESADGVEWEHLLREEIKLLTGGE